MTADTGMAAARRLVLAVLLAASLGAQSMDEYYVKAGFVSSFASFVEWPPEAFKGPREPVSICVLGHNPFGPSLDTLVEGKTVDGRPLVVHQVPGVREAAGCHIVFISASEHLRLRSILKSLQEQSVFSVGDTGDFIAEGGIANLRIESGRVRIEINPDAAREQHLRVSARLLQLAKNVKR